MATPAPALALSLLTDAEACEAYRAAHGGLDRQFFAELSDALAQEARVEPAKLTGRAERLLELARASGVAEYEALAQRARGNLAFACGDYRMAVARYRQALDKFDPGDEVERGRTLSSLLHPLAMLGEAGASLEAAEGARACFERCGDKRRLARLDINLASVWFREDRFAETLAALERAEAGLAAAADGAGDHEAWGAILVSRAVVMINLARFEEAELTYRAARDYARDHDMPAMVAQAEYNIGYLYFLRGQHVKAIRALDEARVTARRLGDKQHLALCDLDQADVCIELKLYEDALRLAHAALGQFEAVGMIYEQGKALSNMAVAEQFLGRDSAALGLLEQAQKAFTSAGNEHWVHLSGLYRGAVLLKMGRAYEAMQLSERARHYFQQRRARTKAVYAGLVAARARLVAQDAAGAQRETERALNLLGELPAPWLRFQAHLLQGDFARLRSDPAAALAAYQTAMDAVEDNPSQIDFDELRVDSSRERTRLYEEALAAMLALEATPEAAWQHVERAKSRGLAAVMAGGFATLEPVGGEGSRVVHEISRLREELNWYYRQLTPSHPSESMSPQDPVRGVETVLAAIQQREHQLLRAIRQLPNDEYRVLEPESAIQWERVRPLLHDATLIEYFHCRDGYFAAVGDQRDLRCLQLPGERAAVESTLRLLRSQVGQQSLEPAYFARHASALQQAAAAHLRLLHQQLIAPLLPWISNQHLVVIPHGVLHAVPFAALQEKDWPLVEDHSVSVAPSAALLLACAQRAPSTFKRRLLVATDPEGAKAEIEAVVRRWSDVTRLEGTACSLTAVRQEAESCSQIHLVTRGAFQGDHPYFAALKLGDGQLNVIDAYNLRLRADLVTLSGGGRSVADLVAGKELMGLDRALLYAGARSVMSSLWTVDDRTTGEFLQLFYQQAAGETAFGPALWRAQQELRQRRSHPYFWAPFQLLGAF